GRRRAAPGVAPARVPAGARGGRRAGGRGRLPARLARRGSDPRRPALRRIPPSTDSPSRPDVPAADEAPRHDAIAAAAPGGLRAGAYAGARLARTWLIKPLIDDVLPAAGAAPAAEPPSLAWPGLERLLTRGLPGALRGAPPAPADPAAEPAAAPAAAGLTFS